MATKKNIEENTEIKPAEAKADIRTPAAIRAAKEGQKTYVVVVARRYDTDKARYLKVDDNPDVIIPTEEEVEVSENEYFELKNSAKLRKGTSKMIEKLVRDTNNSGAAL